MNPSRPAALSRRAGFPVRSLGSTARAFVLTLGVGLGLSACEMPLETDQARLCRMTAPALAAPDAAVTIARQEEDPDGRGVGVDYIERAADAAPQTHHLQCRFLLPGRPRRSEELVQIARDGTPLGEVQRFFLQRFWLATPEGRAADPSPLGDLSRLVRLPPRLAYGAQQALDGLPLCAVYALLAAAYSLIYGLVGRINLAFGELAAAGGYAAALGFGLLVGWPPGFGLSLALGLGVFVAASWGLAASRWVFQPMHRADGQIVLVATIGLAQFMSEGLRLTQGSHLLWIAPVLNSPVAVARSGDFIVTTADNALLAAGLALAAGLLLVLGMRFTPFGRQWRAYADDPLAAQMFGLDPGAIFARSFALASGLAGLGGYIMTLFYGSLGYGAATSLGLKALTAAVLGGIGSIPGALLGGFLVGLMEALWSAAFPIDYRDVAVYAALILTLTLRPGGLLGARESQAR